MAMQRCKISVSVSAANEWNIFQYEKRNFISPRGHVVFYLLYKHQWNSKPFSLKYFFVAKGVIYYVALAMEFMCEDITFLCESWPGISLVFV